MNGSEDARAGLTAARALFVSPHLDDAVLSAGGLVAERAGRGLANEVFTVFAGDPPRPWSGFAEAFHSACGLGEDPVGQRRDEDASAVAVAGAAVVHGDLLDAIYRRADGTGAWLYDREGLTFRAPPPEDAATGTRVVAAVADACRRYRPDLLLGPQAVGGHVDHVLVRDAVRAVGRTTGTAVWLWEDQPYALARTPGADPPGGAAVSLPVGAEAWARRLDALAHYVSQLADLFGEATDWRAVLTRHARRADGLVPHERYALVW